MDETQTFKCQVGHVIRGYSDNTSWEGGFVKCIVPEGEFDYNSRKECYGGLAFRKTLFDQSQKVNKQIILPFK